MPQVFEQSLFLLFQVEDVDNSIASTSAGFETSTARSFQTVDTSTEAALEHAAEELVCRGTFFGQRRRFDVKIFIFLKTKTIFSSKESIAAALDAEEQLEEEERSEEEAR